ncbi:ATP-binding protein [Vannielia litorea]|uniref:histidine kinase n=1 Tax=Vannielia litorea TaxID=1217970 RepID=A0A1N6FQU4_9RHOB|nr:ATP-binding protein [Vannielia litorea]SIN97592.1 response regulator receiver protein [Vannielia litorea]
MLQKTRQFVAFQGYVLFTAIVVISVMGIGYSVIRLDRDSHLSSVRREAEQALSHSTDQIKLRFFGAVQVANKIESLLGPEGEIPERQVALVVEDLQRYNPSVIAVGLAPGLVLTHSFPQADNRSTIGLKYWEIPTQMQSVARAIRAQHPIVAGPLPLVQGGTGFILRYPVFRATAPYGNKELWGVISIVVSAEGMFSGPQSPLSEDHGYIFTLQEVHATSEPRRFVSDAGALPASKPVVRAFNMMGSDWEATAIPRGGWPSYSPQSPYLLAFALLSAIMLVGLLAVLRRTTIKEQNANALLVEAIDCMDEGFIAFDERERLVMVNRTYRDYHQSLAGILHMGVTFEELVDFGLARGAYPQAVGCEAEWKAERLARFRNPKEAYLQPVDNDRWLKVTEAKTPHGYTIGIRTDVTAEKRAQEAAEAADRAKTEFLNNVSHELRTPLTVIFGRASFLRHSEQLPQAKGLAAALDGNAGASSDVATAVHTFQRFVSEQGAGISGSAKHMLRLVEDLLDWSRMARGKIELDLAPTELGEIASSVIEDLHPEAAAKGLEITCSAEQPTEAMADGIRVKQILYNLISNAIKFTDAGHVHVSVASHGDEAVISVTDTGCGIAPDHVDHIFQRFHQVDTSMSRKNGGLGLGLAIAEQLAALHGGTLTVQSRLGQGSTFRLSLPSAEALALPRSA